MKYLLGLFFLCILLLPLYSIPQLEFVDMIYSEEMEDELDSITGIFLSPTHYIVVTDKDNNKIYWISKEGRIVKKMGNTGNEPGEFYEPQDLFIDGKGNLYVADTGNDRIQVFNEKGSFLYQFGDKGDKNGEFKSPTGIYVSEKGQIYVADSGNNRIQVFSKKGVFISKFGTEGSKAGEFDKPVSVAVDEDGKAYVTDRGNSRIQVFDKDGIFMYTIGRKGEDIGEFDQLNDIFYDKEAQRLVISDIGHSLIHLYRKDGSFFASFGSEGDGQGEFSDPYSLMVTEEGKIYIADSGNKRIQIFRIAEIRMEKKEEKAEAPKEPEIKKEKEITAPVNKQSLGVFKFENIGKQASTSDYGEVIAHDLFEEFSKADYFKVFERSRIETALETHGLKDQSINKENAVKTGRDLFLGAGIIGTVSKLKNTIDLDIRIVNILSGIVIHSFYEKINDESRIRDVCGEAVKKIIKYYDENNKRMLKIPTGLNALDGPQAITLSWNKNQEKDLAGYHIYRSESEDGPYEFIGYSSNPNYKDKELDHNKKYFYKITAVNIFGYETDHSIFISSRPMPPPELPVIEGVKIIYDVSHVKIEWKKADKNVLGYNVYRALEDRSEKYEKVKSLTENNFTDMEVQSFQTYYYKVTAYDKAVESKIEDTDAVSVTVKALVIIQKPENIREEATSKSKKVGRVNKDEKLVYLGEEKKTASGNNAYLKIKMEDGTIGWIWRASVKIVE